jgi:hypothetical protein
MGFDHLGVAATKAHGPQGIQVVHQGFLHLEQGPARVLPGPGLPGAQFHGHHEGGAVEGALQHDLRVAGFRQDDHARRLLEGQAVEAGLRIVGDPDIGGGDVAQHRQGVAGGRNPFGQLIHPRLQRLQRLGGGAVRDGRLRHCAAARLSS